MQTQGQQQKQQQDIPAYGPWCARGSRHQQQQQWQQQ
jgi:hypothetical protein